MPSRYFDPLTDYSTPNEAKNYIKDNKIVPSLRKKSEEFISKLKFNLDEAVAQVRDSSDYSIYTGYCGIALYYFLDYRRSGNQQSYETAKSLTFRAIKNLNGKRITFLTGDAGPLALAAVFYLHEGLNAEADRAIHKLLALQSAAPENTPDEMLYGWAGYLYAFTFVDTYHHHPVMPEDEILKSLRKILHHGCCLAQKRGVKSPPMLWEWHKKNYLGAAHGVAGILYTLLQYHLLASDHEKNTLIKPTLDWLISQRYESGNFMSSEGSNEDRLVQWCHGAPGFTSLLILASEVFNDASYFKLAVETGNITWSLGLLKKGYSLCHGVAGNAYTFVRLFKKTKEPRDLYRAAAFMEWCFSYPNAQGLQPDRPYSLFEGLTGVLYFLTDMEDPLDARFPGYG